MALVRARPGPVRRRRALGARPGPGGDLADADSATHPGRWIVERVEWLQTPHAGLLGSQWAQYVSGVLGVAVLVGYTVWWLRRRPVTRREPRVRHATTWALAAPAVPVAGTP
ncbi:hypothetical protein GCM10009718_11340 [Isoptericola halotolerans]|uniref:Iron-regulated membrane protein n=1 Tax=Isoptericola halotolerans TaxID=300560 RepID=A0ABX2A245_9MICO|nr:putative iron-regulated membrane protein [Isoptericola halotolerans]